MLGKERNEENLMKGARDMGKEKGVPLERSKFARRKGPRQRTHYNSQREKSRKD